MNRIRVIMHMNNVMSFLTMRSGKLRTISTIPFMMTPCAVSSAEKIAGEQGPSFMHLVGIMHYERSGLLCLLIYDFTILYNDPF